MENAAYWINRLEMKPHPEGGYYRESFRSKQEVRRLFSAETRRACSSIYYLLESQDFSGFHRIGSDESWYFHLGEPLLIHSIHENGELLSRELSDLPGGNLSLFIEAGLWFASSISSGRGFSLVSCAVAPGFEFSEFEMANREVLVHQFPQHTRIIRSLSR